MMRKPDEIRDALVGLDAATDRHAQVEARRRVLHTVWPEIASFMSMLDRQAPERSERRARSLGMPAPCVIEKDREALALMATQPEAVLCMVRAAVLRKLASCCDRVMLDGARGFILIQHHDLDRRAAALAIQARAWLLESLERIAAGHGILIDISVGDTCTARERWNARVTCKIDEAYWYDVLVEEVY